MTKISCTCQLGIVCDLYAPICTSNGIRHWIDRGRSQTLKHIHNRTSTLSCVLRSAKALARSSFTGTNMVLSVPQIQVQRFCKKNKKSRALVSFVKLTNSPKLAIERRKSSCSLAAPSWIYQLTPRPSQLHQMFPPEIILVPRRVSVRWISINPVLEVTITHNRSILGPFSTFLN